MKLQHAVIFWLIGNILVIAIAEKGVANNCNFEDDVALKYSIFGGVPGDNHIENILMVNTQGLCYYKTLETECCEFTIKDDELKKLLEITKEIVENSNESREGFLPDSTIVAMTLYDGELEYEMLFYADESLEAAYPELRRPEQFKFLEKLLNEIIVNNCCEHEDSCEYSKPSRKN